MRNFGLLVGCLYEQHEDIQTDLLVMSTLGKSTYGTMKDRNGEFFTGLIWKKLVLKCHSQKVGVMAVAQGVRQNRNFTLREAKSAQRRAGGMPWAAEAPGSSIITCSWAGWHIFKCVELKKNPTIWTKQSTPNPRGKHPPLD